MYQLYNDLVSGLTNMIDTAKELQDRMIKLSSCTLELKHVIYEGIIAKHYFDLRCFCYDKTYLLKEIRMMIGRLLLLMLLTLHLHIWMIL